MLFSTTCLVMVMISFSKFLIRFTRTTKYRGRDLGAVLLSRFWGTMEL